QNYETTAIPTLLRKYVRTGKVRIETKPWAFIGPDSFRGQQAMFAAAKQNRAYNFASVLYDNQGTENTGWLNDAMVAQIAASVPGPMDSRVRWIWHFRGPAPAPSDRVSSVRRPDGHRRNPHRSRRRRRRRLARPAGPVRVQARRARGRARVARDDDEGARLRRARVEQRVVPQACE